MVTTDEWTLPDGTPLMYQDGDHVEIQTEDPAALSFTTGYVRGYDMVTDGKTTTVAYYLFNVGNHLSNAIREECLKKTPGRFGINHGRGAHGDGKPCPLCGAGL